MVVSRLQTLWDNIIVVAATTMALALPLGLVFQIRRGLLAETIAGTITVLFMIDVGVRYHRLRQQAASHALSTQQRKQRYLGLVYDVIGATPLYLFIGVTPLESIRLLKLVRVGKLQKQWRLRDVRSSNTLRLLFFVYWLALSAHWVSCGWVALEGLSTEVSMGSQYLNALYWCVATLTTVGYGDVLPTNDVQKIYTIVVMLLGIGVYAYIIGNIASILSNLDPARALHLQRMERMDAFMRYRQLPRPLRRRVRAYYRYLWTHRVGHDEHELLRELPPSLRTEVALTLKKDLIEKVPLFQNTSPAFVRDIALEMRAVVYMPGDWIVREGARGQDMYFISQGSVDVIAPDGITVYRTLREGEFFGEIALFFEQPRTASVRATTYCDLYRLEKSTFDRILEDYPKAAEHMRQQALARKQEQ